MHVLQEGKFALARRPYSCRYLWFFYYILVSSAVFILVSFLSFSSSEPEQGECYQHYCINNIMDVAFSWLYLQFTPYPILMHFCFGMMYVCGYPGMGIWAYFSTFPCTWIVGLPKSMWYWWKNWYLVTRLYFICYNVRLLSTLLQISFCSFFCA